MQPVKFATMQKLFYKRVSMLGATALCASLGQAGGYVPFCGDNTCAPRVQHATAIEVPGGATILPSFNNATMTDQNTIAETNNNPIKTPSSADPVSTVTGNNYHDETDFTILGRAGLNYAFTRTYNSAPSSTKVDLGLGHGWVHSYGMRLVSNHYGKFPNCSNDTAVCPENADNVTSSVTYTDERGGDHNYLVNGTTVTAPQGEFDSLVLDSPAGVHTLTFRNGTKYVFETVGAGTLRTTPNLKARLKQILDPWGNALNFTYDGSGRLWKVEDNLGITNRTGLVFTYDADNHIRTIKDWTNRTWTYIVNADDNLDSFTGPETLTAPGAVSMKYTYVIGANNQVTHNLHTFTKPLARNGVPVRTTFNYYENGRTFNDYNGTLDTETLDYDLFRSSTRITDPRGGVREYQYDSSGRLTQLVQADGSIQKFVNNAADGLRYSKTDALGYTTQYSYRSDNTFGTASNTYGNVTMEKDPLNNTITTTYSTQWCDQVTSGKDKRGNTTSTTLYTAPGTCAALGKPDTVTLDKLTSGTAVYTNLVLRKYCWHADGTLQSLTEYLDPDNAAHTRVTTYTYTSAAHLLVDNVTVTGWDGTVVTTSFGYDALGRKTSETLQRRTSPAVSTPMALTTTYDYDARDRVTLMVDPKGNRFIKRYDDNGQLWQETVEYRKPDLSYEMRNVVTRTFDAAERVLTATDHEGGVTRHQYDEAGNVVALTNPDNHTTRYEYDLLNRRTAVIDANGSRTTTAYNLRGEVKSVTNPAGETVRYEYDKAGRRTKITDPQLFVTAMSYDANGNVTCVIDANANVALQPKNSDGCTVSTQYDELNRPIVVRDALNGTTSTRYDMLGQPIRRTDAEGRRYIWNYDGQQRLVGETDFTGNSTTYQRDEAGNIWRITNRLNEVKETTFDVLNRPTEVKYLLDNSTETFGYDVAGNIASVANGTVGYTFQYDKLNRLKNKTDSRGRSLSFTYSPAGNLLTKTTYSGATTTYTYDAANHLVNMSNPDYVSVNYQNDAAGRVLSRILSSGAKSLYTYDAGGLLSSQKHMDATGATIIDQSFTRDRVGNITAIAVAGGGTTGYALDALYRLKTVTAPNAADSEAFSYDRLGNRVTSTRGGITIGASGSTTHYYLYYPATQTGTVAPDYLTPTFNNRLKEIRVGSVGGTIDSAFVYNNEGRTTSQTGSTPRTFTWDAKGRLVSEGTETYAYDPNNHRIRRTGGTLGTLDYFLEGEHLESVYKGNKIQEKYFRGLSIDELVAGFTTQNGKLVPFFFQHDQVNSVVAVSKPNGGTQQKVAYRAFGEDQSSTGTAIARLKYTGREDDGTGLYQYRARYYDPKVGRFISEDPKKFEAGANFYAYVENNPVNSNDPFGLLTEVINFKGVGAGSSSQGHVAVNFNGMVYSWQPGANNPMFVKPVAEYMSQNNFRDAIGRTLNVTPIQETIIGMDLANYQKTNSYNLLLNNCADPIQAILKGVGVNLGTTITPNGLAQSLDKSGAVSGYKMYPQTVPGAGWTAPWAADLPLPDLNFGSATGGFLIYPNKPNNNMLLAPYTKKI